METVFRACHEWTLALPQHSFHTEPASCRHSSRPPHLSAGLLTSVCQPAATRQRAAASHSLVPIDPLLTSARPSVRRDFISVVLFAAGDRNSVGSTGSVGSTRSAGSGQSTESNNAPNGLQHNTGHHDNTNKVHKCSQTCSRAIVRSGPGPDLEPSGLPHQIRSSMSWSRLIFPPKTRRQTRWFREVLHEMNMRSVKDS